MRLAWWSKLRKKSPVGTGGDGTWIGLGTDDDTDGSVDADDFLRRLREGVTDRPNLLREAMNKAGLSNVSIDMGFEFALMMQAVEDSYPDRPVFWRLKRAASLIQLGVRRASAEKRRRMAAEWRDRVDDNQAAAQ